MKRLIACCASLAFAVMPAGAVDFGNLTTRQMEELRNAPSRPLPSWVLQPGCTLYEHVNGGGKSWRFRADARTKIRARYNGVEHEVDIGEKNLPASALGKVSSAKCDGTPGRRRCSARLFDRPDQAGPRAVSVTGGAGVKNLPAHINDKVASIYIICDVD